MITLDEEMKRVRKWKAKNDQLLAKLRWENRSRDSVIFHNRILENLERMRVIADAGKIAEITRLGGFRIYLVEAENIPSYCEDFEGKYQACERYFHFRRYQESLIPTYFGALRSREGLENIPKDNAEKAIRNLDEIVSIPFDDTDIAGIVNSIDDIRERDLGLERYKLYPDFKRCKLSSK